MDLEQLVFLPFQEEIEKRKEGIKDAFTHLWNNPDSLYRFGSKMMKLGYTRKEAIQKALDTLKHHPDYQDNTLEGLEKIVNKEFPQTKNIAALRTWDEKKASRDFIAKMVAKSKH